MFVIPVDTNILTPGYAKVAKALVVINLVAYILTVICEPSSAWLNDPNVVQAAPNFMYDNFQLNPEFSLNYRLITHQFLHADFMHFLWNMIVLIPFAAVLEEKLGVKKTVAFYLLGGVFAGIVWQVFYTGQAPAVGASGSISALLGACIVLRPKMPITSLWWMLLIHFFRIPVWAWALFYFGADVFYFNASTGDNTAYEAHIGGFVANFFLCVLALVVRVIPPTSSDLLGSMGIKIKRVEVSAEEKFKTGSSGYHDASTVDHVISDLQAGESEKHNLANILVLSKRSVNMGKVVEGYQLLQSWIEDNDDDPQAYEVSNEIALICLRHLHKKELARDWLSDTLGREMPEEYRQQVQTMYDNLD